MALPPRLVTAWRGPDGSSLVGAPTLIGPGGGGAGHLSSRTVTTSESINAANHAIGQLVVAASSSPILLTLADDLPLNSTGSILRAGSGSVTVTVESGALNVATGKLPVIDGEYESVTWVKTEIGVIIMYGALIDDTPETQDGLYFSRAINSGLLALFIEDATVLEQGDGFGQLNFSDPVNSGLISLLENM